MGFIWSHLNISLLIPSHKFASTSSFLESGHCLHLVLSGDAKVSHNFPNLGFFSFSFCFYHEVAYQLSFLVNFRVCRMSGVNISVTKIFKYTCMIVIEGNTCFCKKMFFQCVDESY